MFERIYPGFPTKLGFERWITSPVSCGTFSTMGSEHKESGESGAEEEFAFESEHDSELCEQSAESKN